MYELQNIISSNIYVCTECKKIFQVVYVFMKRKKYIKRYFRICTIQKNMSRSIHAFMQCKDLFQAEHMYLRSAKTYVNKLSYKYKLEAKRLLPDKNYVGFSITQGNVYRAKSWALKNFITLACKLEERNKTPVFFVEKKNKELQPNLISRLHFMYVLCF